MGMGMIDSNFSVTVPRLEVIEKLKANLSQHKADYLEAVDAYFEEVEKKLKAELKKFKSKPRESVRVSLSFPVTYADSYETAIEMLEMSVDENIVLNRDMFVKFVKDEWEWKNSFAAGTLSYIAGKAG